MIDRWIDTVSREWPRTAVVEKIGHTVHNQIYIFNLILLLDCACEYLSVNYLQCVLCEYIYKTVNKQRM